MPHSTAIPADPTALAPRHATLVHALRAAAAARPARVAYRWLEPGGEMGEEITYAELDERVRTVGAALRDSVAARSRILLVHPPGIDYLVSFLGCLEAGMIAVPAYPPARDRGERIASIIADCMPGAVVTSGGWERALSDRLAVAATSTPVLTSRSLCRPNAGRGSVGAVPGVGDVAFLQYTSGSTAEPRGVVLTHGNLAANSESIAQALGHDESSVIVSWLPLFHDMGLIGNALQAVWLGATAVILAPETFLRRPIEWLRAISRFGGTTSGAPNFAYDLCATRILAEDRATLDLASWRIAFNGAEPVRPSTLRRFARTFAPCGFDAGALYPCYGLAEAALLVTGPAAGNGATVRRFDADALERRRVASAAADGVPLVACGSPAPGQRVTIRTPTGDEVPAGTVGEICVEGPSVARGYYGQREDGATFQVVAATGRRRLRTGDLGFLHEGQLYVTARITDQIIVRGRTIAPQDLEATAELAGPALRRGCVVAFPVERDEQELVVLVAEVRDSHAGNADERLAEQVRAAVASRHGIPVHAVLLVSLGQVDKTSSGKVRRQRVRERMRRGELKVLAQVLLPPLADAVERPLDGDGDGDGAATPVAGLVRDLVAAVLGRPADEVALHASPAALGLDSLQMIELAARVAEAGLGELRPEEVLEARSMRDLADRLGRRLATAAASVEGSPPPEGSVRDEAAATPTQRRLWLLDALGDVPAAAAVPIRLELTGTLKEDRLRGALAAVVRLHPVLRLRLEERPDGLWQRLETRDETLPLTIHDLRTLAARRRGEAQRRLIDEAVAERFDLTHAPLWRAVLVRRDESEATLLVVFHHTIADGWSVRVFLEDLTRALVHREPLDRPERRGYLEHAAAVSAGADAPEHLEYWRRELAGAPEALDLPFARPRTPVQTFAAAAVRLRLDDGAGAALRARAADAGMTPLTIALSAYAALLSRCTGQADVLVGVPLAERGPGLRDVMGPLLNTLPLHLRCDGASTLAELAGQVSESLRGAIAHAVPFETICDVAGVERDPSRPRLCQAFFNHLAFGPRSWSADGLRLQARPILDAAAKLDLCLYMLDADDGIEFELVYNRALFAHRHMAALLEQYRIFLDALITDPTARAGSVSLRTKALDSVVGDPRAPLPVRAETSTVDELLVRVRRHATEARARVALQDACSVWTWSDLADRVDALAGQLLAAGVIPGAGHVVALHARRGAALTSSILAVLRAGAAVWVVDAELPDARMGAHVAVARPAIWIDLPGSAKPGDDTRAELRRTGTRKLSLHGTPAPAPPLPDRVPGDAPATLVFTSGSMGVPKAVLGARDALTAFLPDWERRHRLGHDDRFAMLSALAHDPLQRDVLTAAWCGGVLAVPDPDVHADPELLWRWLCAERITVANLSASLVRFLDAGRGPAQAKEAPALRLAAFVGEPLDVATARRARAAFPAARLVNLYGTTETQRALAAHTLTDAELAADVPAHALLPVGSPPPGAQLVVVTGTGIPAGMGEPGEVWMRSRYLALGYAGDEALTRERFLPNPFRAAPDSVDRIYRTGDRGRLDADGRLHLLGRNDRQLQIRGHRVEPAEVEAALRTHPDVHECAVLGREAEIGGIESLIGYVVARAGAAARGEELREHLAHHLAKHQVPTRFVHLAELPRTPSGKVDHVRLAAFEPTEHAATAPQSLTSPRETEIQDLRLALLWAEVLGATRLDGATFFEAGGNSLRAAELLARLRDEHGVHLSMRELFEHPTLEGIVALARERQAPALAAAPGTSVRADPTHRFHPFPLNDIQQAYWVGRRVEFEGGGVASHAYAEFDGDGLDPGRFERAWQRLIERHDMLRCVVTIDGHQQVIDPAPRLPLPVHDLRQSGPAEVAGHLARVRDRLSHVVRDGHHWPLFDVELTLLPGGRHRVHLSFDFLVADASSWGVLAPELTAFYQDPDASLPMPEFTFRDYVLAEQRLTHEPRFARAQAYWRERVATLAPGPELPLAADPATVRAPRFERLEGAIDAERSARLRTLAAQLGVTPSALLAAAFAEILSGWSATTRFTLNLTLFNRLPLHPEVPRLVGDFTSLTLIEVDVAEPADLADLARRVHEGIWEALDHREFSGPRTLRDSARVRAGEHLRVPVVFTSKLGVSDVVAVEDALGWMGRRGFSVTQTPQVWLDHQVSEEPATGALRFNWDHIAALFPPGMVDEMFGAYQRLLHALADDPVAVSRRWEGFLASAQNERRQLANATDTRLPRGLLHGPLQAVGRANPQAPAVLAHGRTLTHGELAGEAASVATWLREQGAGVDELVAVVMDKGWEQVVAAAGIAAAGAAYLPVDAAWPADRVRQVLELGRVRHVVTQTHVLSRHPGLRHLPHLVPRIGATAASIPCPASPYDLAYVIFTSGSTGTPQGAMLEHRAALNTVLDVNQRHDVGPGDRVLGVSGLGFDLSVYDIFGVLGAGGSLVLPAHAQLREPAAWHRLLHRTGTTIWNSAPALMVMLVEWLERHRQVLPESLRVVLLSGDWIPVDLPARIRRLRPGVRVVSMGGATEAAIWSIDHPAEDHDPAWPSVPYGRPMANQRFHVLDPLLRTRPEWAVGSLHIAGVGLARGYWGNPELTAARFITHPRTGERLYRTGDLGRVRPSGDIELMGREDFQVKIQGHRVEPGEVEAVLAEHPAIQRAVVIPAGDASRGRRLVAHVVLADRHEEPGALAAIAPPSLAAELASHVDSRLPHNMVPASFVVLASVPITANGKIDRSGLPDPESLRPATSAAAAQPDPLEAVVVKAFREVLGASAIDPADNFFDLGGTSLSAVELQDALRRLTGTELALTELFRHATPGAIAGALTERAEARPPQGEDLEAARRRGETMRRARGRRSR